MEVFRRRDWDIHQVIFPEGLTKYDQNMDGVDWSNHLREHGSGFYYKSHSKKWYKHNHLGLCNFGILNSRIASNMISEKKVVCGVILRETLKKWQFSAIITE